MLFRQFVDDDLGCASYLVGDEHAGVAAVVDPAYAIEQYLAEADRRGVRIVRVLETHTHADHVSGHGRLALEHDAVVGVHAAAEPDFPFEPLEDGQEVELGRTTIRVLHAPGHRPEHCAFAVVDRARADEPWLVLTGDSLFVGDAGRPDLAVAARTGAEGLFHSLRRLAALGDGVEIYPGHVAGSLCGAGMSSKASSTIGFERRFNRTLALALEHEHDDEFVDTVAAITAPRPPNAERIVGLNRGPFLGAPPPVAHVHRPAGATVLDVRPAPEFVAGHVAGALNVPLSTSSFATKAGFVLLPGERVVLHTRDEDEAQRAATGLRSVGFLDIDGWFADAPTAAQTRPVELDELERLLQEGSVDVLDVREIDERDRGYIAGSRHVPYRLLRACTADVCDGERAVVTICETGARAAIAASILTAAGIEARPVLDGGVATWRARGNDIVEFRRCGS